MSDDLILKRGPQHSDDTHRAAARAVAHYATDATEAADLLAMLGLTDLPRQDPTA